MPLTLSHPAAVLPLRGLDLPVTALVAGSMVPDVPLFLGWTRGYEVTHRLLGVVTVDPILATLALVVCSASSVTHWSTSPPMPSDRG